MKKLITGLMAAFLMVAGLVTVSGGTAVAAQYPHTVPTRVIVNAPGRVKRGNKATIKVRVAAPSNATPAGQVRIVVKRNGGGYYLRKQKFYGGGKIKFVTTRLTKRGNYTVKARFIPSRASRFRKSVNFDSIKVV